MTNDHWLLCRAADFSAARGQVQKFFARSLLVRYDRLMFAENNAWHAGQPQFWPQIEAGVQANRRLLDGLIADLRGEGCQDFADLITLGEGYQSKLLHLVAHLLDGFIGIDTVFYNLLADSHWLSDKIRLNINANPENHWLLRVEAGFASPEDAALVHRLPKER